MSDARIWLRLERVGGAAAVAAVRDVEALLLGGHVSRAEASLGLHLTAHMAHTEPALRFASAMLEAGADVHARFKCSHWPCASYRSPPPRAALHVCIDSGLDFVRPPDDSFARRTLSDSQLAECESRALDFARVLLAHGAFLDGLTSTRLSPRGDTALSAPLRCALSDGAIDETPFAALVLSWHLDAHVASQAARRDSALSARSVDAGGSGGGAAHATPSDEEGRDAALLAAALMAAASSPPLLHLPSLSGHARDAAVARGVEALLAAGALADGGLSEPSEAPLVHAAAAGHLSAARLLFRRMQSVIVAGSEDSAASRRRYAEIFTVALRAIFFGVDARWAYEFKRFDAPEFHPAQRDAALELAQDLIAAGAAVDGFGCTPHETPLALAAGASCDAAAHFLLEKLAAAASASSGVSGSASGVDRAVLTAALGAAISSRRRFDTPRAACALVRTLINAGADAAAPLLPRAERARHYGRACAGHDLPHEAEGVDALMRAVLARDAILVLILLARGTHADARDASGATPLLRAAEVKTAAERWQRLGRIEESAALEIARLLLAAGADPNAAEDTCGWTSLLGASKRGNAAMVALLLGAGADPNLAEADGCTPLLQLTHKRWVNPSPSSLVYDPDDVDVNACVGLLLAAGANAAVTARGSNGQPPLLGALDVAERYIGEWLPVGNQWECGTRFDYDNFDHTEFLSAQLNIDTFAMRLRRAPDAASYAYPSGALPLHIILRAIGGRDSGEPRLVACALEICTLNPHTALVPDPENGALPDLLHRSVLRAAIPRDLLSALSAIALARRGGAISSWRRRIRGGLSWPSGE